MCARIRNRKVFFCLTGPYLTRRATIGRLANPSLAGGGSLETPLRATPTSITAYTQYGPGFIGKMTPGDKLPPPSRPVEPPFSVGDVREVEPLSGEDFPKVVTARPRMGGRRAVERRRLDGPRLGRPLMESRPHQPPVGEGGDGW